MDSTKYQVGKGVTPEGFRLWILYHPPRNDLSVDELVSAIWGEGRHAEGTTLPPGKILEHRPHIFHYQVVNGIAKTTKIEQELSGWFERKCSEAKCEWFVPMVKRMATGECVSLEEIKAGFLTRNDKPMPCGKGSELFR